MPKKQPVKRPSTFPRPTDFILLDREPIEEYRWADIGHFPAYFPATDRVDIVFLSRGFSMPRGYYPSYLSEGGLYGDGWEIIKLRRLHPRTGRPMR